MSWTERDDLEYHSHMLLDERQAELAHLAAENARLREALTRIVAGHPATNPAAAEQWLSGVEMAEMAREALTGSGLRAGKGQ